MKNVEAIAKLFTVTRSRQEFLDNVVQQVQAIFALQCVGIRVLNADGTIPYASYTGFSKEFWTAENCLCVHTDRCVCIRMIVNEFIPKDREVLSDRNSVWSNDLQAFGRSIPADTLPKYRGQCIAGGFQTLAVIALRSEDEVIGLLHLADRRPDRLSRESIDFLECLANAIGAVILRFQVEEQLLEAKRLAETAKSAAEDASRAKSEFLAIASHEIRTPMAVIVGALEHLSAHCTGADTRLVLELAEESADRLMLFIDDVLDLSRLEARRMETENRPFDLHACVGKAVHLFALKARAKGLSLKLFIDHRVPRVVNGDGARLGQVLINLVNNAGKFTEKGGITVRVEPVEGAGAEYRFFVQDTGTGIPAAKLGLIFESFRQVDASLTRKHRGAGLGLAIAKGLVELLGGSIGVTSHEGEGSTFFFVLPLPAAPHDEEQH